MLDIEHLVVLVQRAAAFELKKKGVVSYIKNL